MKMKHTTFIYALALLLAVQGTLSTSVSAEPVTVDSKTIERLENLINNQQKQLEAQQKAEEYCDAEEGDDAPEVQQADAFVVGR